MAYTSEKLLKELGVEAMPEQFFDYFDETMAEYDKLGVFYLEDDFTKKLNDSYAFLPAKIDFVLKSAKRVRESELCARYSYLLYKMLVRADGKVRISLNTCCPQSEDVEKKVDFEMAAYFAVLAFAPKMIEYYEGRGLPKEIITSTLNDCFEGTIFLRNVTHGRDGFSDETYFNWNQLYTNYSIIRVGVLNFEINQTFPSQMLVLTDGKGNYEILADNLEISDDGYLTGAAGYPDAKFTATVTETEDEYIGYPIDKDNARVKSEKIALKKSEWRVALKKGDPTISVHIPTGVSVDSASCEYAYRECIRAVKEYFPEYKVKAIRCASWLLDPQMRDMLPPESKILQFQSKYMRFPNKSQGRGVFSFLFRKQCENYEELPESTSLMRKVKAHYISGKYIYEPGGVIFFDQIDGL